MSLPIRSFTALEAFPKHYWNAQHICDGLYLGNATASNDFEWLKSEGINRVIRVMTPSEIKLHEYPGIIYHCYPIVDKQGDIIGTFNDAREHIYNALTNGEKVLIHCLAGKSRSASIVIAYLMSSQKIGYQEAYTIVAKQRPCIDPHLLFCIALSEAKFD